MVGSDVLRFLGDLNREAVEIINIKILSNSLGSGVFCINPYNNKLNSKYLSGTHGNHHKQNTSK